MRTLPTIDYAEARRIIDFIVEKASQMQKAAAVAIADSHGDLICFARMDGAPVSSIRIAMNKAWTAARERKPTKEIGEKGQASGKGPRHCLLWRSEICGMGRWNSGLEERRSSRRGRGQRPFVE